MSARFKFTGTIAVSDNFSKHEKCKDGKKYYQRVNLQVVQAKNNRAFVEYFACEQANIKTMDTDGNKIEIELDARDDAEVIKKVASYRKNVITLNDERHEFIYGYDFARFLVDHKDEIVNKMFTVTGTVEKNFYQGKVSDKFIIQNMYEENADEVKPKLTVDLQEYWTVEDYDFDDFAEEKKVYINGKISEFLNKNVLGGDEGANKYVDQQLVLDATKIDFENEKHTALLDYELAQIGLVRDGMKIKVKPGMKKKDVYTLGFTCTYVNGQEKVDFDESTLTPNQKTAIALGLSKLEDFIPKGDAYGTRVQLYKINKFDLRDKASEGCYATELTMSEYEDEFYVPAKEESLEEVVAKAEKAASKDEDDELDSLFD